MVHNDVFIQVLALCDQKTRAKLGYDEETWKKMRIPGRYPLEPLDPRFKERLMFLMQLRIDHEQLRVYHRESKVWVQFVSRYEDGELKTLMLVDTFVECDQPFSDAQYLSFDGTNPTTWRSDKRLTQKEGYFGALLYIMNNFSGALDVIEYEDFELRRHFTTYARVLLVE